MAQTPVAQRVLAQCPEASVVRQPVLSVSPDEKEPTLYLMENPGVFFKPCPATPEYVCCNYRILNFGTGCPIQCTYCILNGYLHSRALTHFCDHDRLFVELDKALNAEKGFVRIGSGEFTDSLVIDHLTDFSREIIPFFLKRKDVLFEIKTKTDNVENLLQFNGKRKILVSWSVNPQSIIDQEEKGSASLTERLAAAKKCMESGYLIGFHFDPILRHEGWEEGYTRVVKAIYQYVDPEVIAWISLGGFRFVPELKEVIQRHYPTSRITQEEFVRGRDGKMRYFRPLREEMYRHIISEIRKYHPTAPLYFCMESPQVWERMMGRTHFCSDSLAGLLNETRKRFCL